MEARADEQLSSYFYTYVPVRARTSLKKQLLSCSSALASYPKYIYYSIDETSFHILRIEKNAIFLYICIFFRTFAEIILTHHIMPQMIMLDSEMIRINPAKKTIEYSTSGGRSWSTRYSSSSCGEFIDLLPYGNELLAVTSKGIYYSTSQGRSWSSRYTSSTCGEFQCLMDGGRELLAQTSKGLYYSTSSGRSWSKRR